MKFPRFLFSIVLTILLLVVFFLPVMAQAVDPPAAESTQKALNLGTLFAEGGVLTLFISSCVAQLKSWGLKGKKLDYSAYAVGVIFGGGYRFFTYNPATAAEWFYLVLFGMICGFIATGIYKGFESATGGKAIKEEIAARAAPPCPEETQAVYPDPDRPEFQG